MLPNQKTTSNVNHFLLSALLLEQIADSLIFLWLLQLGAFLFCILTSHTLGGDAHQVN